MTSCDHPEPCVLVTTEHAAKAVHVEPVTIRSWARRGWISRRGTDGRQATWCLQEVREAELREPRVCRGYAPR